ncbi:MAG: AAA family ATPase, partial [Clostridia bacterium]|nr:AAA family ATPase [Clostridia bacterium]
FTEDEVQDLCVTHGIDFDMMKTWYDGYAFSGVGSVYNPYSVMQAIENDDFDSYWTETSAAEGLLEYISKDYHGLTKTIAELIGGVEVKVSTTGFANNLTTLKGKDDVLTLLIHLGYLAYNAEQKTARIPNEEIKLAFQKAVREVRHKATLQRLEESEKLFAGTIHGNATAVAAQIEKVHSEETVPLHYNKEDSLRSVIKLAYYTYRDHYLQLEELPSGEGYADVIYLPLQGSDWPALIIELKWNKSAQGAIDQIKDRGYIDGIKDYGGRIGHQL